MRGYKSASGGFQARESSHGTLTVKCGKCIGCRLDKSREWATRCVHEASLHEQNCFVTLTFSDEHLPWDYSVSVRDVQLFMKRLRKGVGRVRFFAVGEYGGESLRPHYHLLLFGYNFADRRLWSKTPSGSFTYISEYLAKLWPFGMHTIGDVTRESAAYCARYSMKKIGGVVAASHYRRVHPITGELVQVRPEFAVMSRRPGIGADWFDNFMSDAFPSDFVIIDGRKVKPPRYYHKLLARQNPDAASDVTDDRLDRMAEPKVLREQTDERLAVREEVQAARVERLKRNLE